MSNFNDIYNELQHSLSSPDAEVLDRRDNEICLFNENVRVLRENLETTLEIDDDYLRSLERDF